MKLFLNKTLSFILLPLLVVVIFIVILDIFNTKIAESEKVDNHVTTAFLGDSHIVQSVNDNLLQNCINVARNSETYYFSYFRLKFLLKNNPSIKTVCLGYSYHSLSSYNDKFIDGEYSNVVSSRYFFMLPLNEKLKLLNANKNNVSSYLKAIIKNGIKNMISDDKSFEGGFNNNFSKSEAETKSIDKRILFQFYTEGKVNDFSKINIEYLLKIKDLCENSNIKLVLINTPLHRHYKENVPSKFKNKFNDLIESHQINLIDMSDYLTDKSTFIPDGDHVSQQGALRTTEYLALKLNIQFVQKLKKQ